MQILLLENFQKKEKTLFKVFKNINKVSHATEDPKILMHGNLIEIAVYTCLIFLIVGNVSFHGPG